MQTPLKSGWHYDKQFPYGSPESYIKAAAFLNDGPVEDWGCGTAWAKHYVTQPYKGIDGAPPFADVVTDLTTYTSKTHGILLRHVLEHNVEWKKILLNALKSASKIALVIYTPFGKKTQQIAWNEGYEVPNISFCKKDLTDLLPNYTEETFPSDTAYGQETIFYICAPSTQPSTETTTT